MTYTVRFGSVSSGTMRPEDLIPTFASELQWLTQAGRIDRTDEVSKLLAEADEIETDEDGYYYDDKEASNILDALFDALNELAPPYGYFGAFDGDGADYGFWLSWDALDELPKVNAGEEPPADAEEYIAITDHGNVSLYARQEDGSFSEVWAVV